MGTASTPPPDGRDLYQRLGVPPDASEEEIRRAYRHAARAHHPDVEGDADPGRFRDVTDAYDVLRDTDRRRAYDAMRGSRAANSSAARRVRIPVHRAGERRTREVTLPLTFDQAALGTTALVEVDVLTSCQACDGTGRGVPSPCTDCDGTGHTGRVSGGITIRHTCRSCGGTGSRSAPRCTACAGTGRTTVPREVRVEVPAGVEDGTRLRVPPDGPGEQLVAVVQVAAHAYFARRGRDLTLDLPVTIAEATLGGVVTVPTLDGAVAIRLPPGTPHGRTFRVRRQGIPHPDGPGDLLATVEVVIPTQLNDDQRAALEAFAAVTTSPRRHLER
jgi:molecular chaperone DnaJ